MKYCISYRKLTQSVVIVGNPLNLVLGRETSKWLLHKVLLEGIIFQTFIHDTGNPEPMSNGDEVRGTSRRGTRKSVWWRPLLGFYSVFQTTFQAIFRKKQCYEAEDYNQKGLKMPCSLWLNSCFGSADGVSSKFPSWPFTKHWSISERKLHSPPCSQIHAASLLTAWKWSSEWLGFSLGISHGSKVRWLNLSFKSP